MGITTKQTNPGETTLIFSGQLDFTVREEFQIAFQNAQTREMRHILLDLTQVSFIDCATIGILVQAKQELAKTQVTLSLIVSQGHVFDVLHIVQLDKIIPIVSPKQTA